MFWQGKAVLRCNSSLCRWFSGPKPTNISTLVRMFEGWHFYSGGIPLTLVSPPQGISPHIDSLHSPTVSTSDSTSKSSAREMEERCLVIFFCRGNSFLFVDTFKIKGKDWGECRKCQRLLSHSSEAPVFSPITLLAAASIFLTIAATCHRDGLRQEDDAGLGRNLLRMCNHYINLHHITLI